MRIANIDEKGNTDKGKERGGLTHKKLKNFLFAYS